MTDGMENALILKLQSFASLTANDLALLRRVTKSPRTVDARIELARRSNGEGEGGGHVHLVLSGFACLAKYLRDGSRKIVAFLIPGDFCVLDVRMLRTMDYALETLSECAVVDIAADEMAELLSRPAIEQAFQQVRLVEECTLREWIVNVGGRPADQRIAHLFCELYARLRMVGLADNFTLAVPISQTVLGEAVGFSSVHTNRSVQSLRHRGLIHLADQELKILDLRALRAMCGFAPSYLNLGELSALGATM